MIATRNIPSLTNLVSGKSNKTLIMGCSTMENMNEWFNKLKEVCDGTGRLKTLLEFFFHSKSHKISLKYFKIFIFSLISDKCLFL